MKGESDIISAIQHLRITVEHLGSFQREHKETKGFDLFEGYKKKISWIYNDMISHPFLPDVVRKGIKREWESDVFQTNAIAESVALLSPDQRELVEKIIEGLLAGEQIQFVP